MQQPSRLDQWIGHLLWVKGQPTSAAALAESDAQRAFSFSLIFTGIRCILQYIILPFLLPLIGIAAELTLPLMLIINLAAIVSAIYSVRRFWQINYQYRWQYLLFALFVIGLLFAFMALDLTSLNQPIPE